jgi:hypothetical protein
MGRRLVKQGAPSAVPIFYAVLLASAALVNAAGYLLGLWQEETSFDEAAHFYTSFCGVAALAWGGGRTGLLRQPARWWVLLSIGLVLGIAWEAVEWLLGIIGGRRDTLIDLAMDAAGAMAAAPLGRWALTSGRAQP